MQTIIKDFSEEDIKTFKYKRKQNSISLFIAISLSSFFIYSIYASYFDPNEIENNKYWDDHIFAIIIPLVAVFVVFCFIYFLIKIQKDIKLSKKELLIGTLTKKEKTLMYSYFYLGEHKIEIGNWYSYYNLEYEKIEIGETVAIERTMNTGHIFQILVFKEDE